MYDEKGGGGQSWLERLHSIAVSWTLTDRPCRAGSASRSGWSPEGTNKGPHVYACDSLNKQRRRKVEMIVDLLIMMSSFERSKVVIAVVVFRGSSEL